MKHKTKQAVKALLGFIAVEGMFALIIITILIKIKVLVF